MSITLGLNTLPYKKRFGAGRRVVIKGELMNKIALLTSLFLSFGAIAATDLNFYLEDAASYNSSVPKPSDVLGFEVGDWHVRHDQLVAYMTTLAGASNRAVLQNIGKSHERRQLLHLIFSSPENLANLETIRKAHVDAALGKSPASDDLPIVIYLGYSIHGNEPSGSNASMLVAYHLAASPNIESLLKHAIIIVDPSLNPDGLGRFAHWANMHKGDALVAHSRHREHAEHWPTGRTNHYWYDLNRDWLLLQHPESVARIERFHHWRPNILGDFHEMGTQSSYFFQPGVPSRQNPLTPDQNLSLTRAIAKYHAKALDQQGKLYFSEQQFDDFYYGKGSTYPDIQGCIGILFEQASSRGHLQVNSYGSLSFPQTIKNQLTTSLSTMQAGLENRKAIKTYQAAFFSKAREKAKQHSVKAYVFGGRGEPHRALAMANILKQHQIEVFHLAKPLEQKGARISDGFVVPVDQAQFLLIKSVFDQVTTFNDNTFYDISTWHFPSAFGVDYQEVGPKQFKSNLLGEAYNPSEKKGFKANLSTNQLAFAIDWRHHLAPKYAYKLIHSGYRVRGAVEPFTAQTTMGSIDFERGTLMVHSGIQDKSLEKMVGILESAAAAGIPVYAIESGLTSKGQDLGSRSFVAIQKPKVALIVGRGVSTGEAGEMWHLLDKRYNIHLALIDKRNLSATVLDDFTHVIMVDGFYSDLDESIGKSLAGWVRRGGNLIAVKRAVQWAADQGIVTVTFKKRKSSGKEDEAPKASDRLAYGERSGRNALDLISGTIFQANIDLTHPVAFGYQKPRIELFRNHNRMMEIHKDPYATVASYTKDPLMSGYVSKENIDRIKETAAIIAVGKGRGSVVALMDNPTFRGFWLGTQRLLLNGLFFGDAITSSRFDEEDNH